MDHKHLQEKTVVIDSAMSLSSAVGLAVITWKPKNADKSKHECICSPFPEGALISKLLKVSCLIQHSALQGCTKRWAPGCVKLGEKVAFCLPSEGRKTQYIFS